MSIIGNTTSLQSMYNWDFLIFTDGIYAGFTMIAARRLVWLRWIRNTTLQEERNPLHQLHTARSQHLFPQIFLKFPGTAPYLPPKMILLFHLRCRKLPTGITMQNVVSSRLITGMNTPRLCQKHGGSLNVLRTRINELIGNISG